MRTRLACTVATLLAPCLAVAQSPNMTFEQTHTTETVLDLTKIDPDFPAFTRADWDKVDGLFRPTETNFKRYAAALALENDLKYEALIEALEAQAAVLRGQKKDDTKIARQ